MTQLVSFDIPADGMGPFRAEVGERSIEHDVYAGGSGPAVILLHELDGMNTRHFEDLAEHVAQAGFSVYAPDFFHGTIGGGIACIRKEFVCWSTGITSPVVAWLQELAVEAQRRDPDHRRVGAIGMCYTGGFALGMVASAGPVRAAVVAQPSLPLGGPAFLFPRRRERAFGLSESDRSSLERRLRDGSAKVLPLRFQRDWICPKARVDALAALEGAEEVHYVDGFGHPTLTAHFRKAEGHAGSKRAIDTALAWLADVL